MPYVARRHKYSGHVGFTAPAEDGTFPLIYPVGYPLLPSAQTRSVRLSWFFRSLRRSSSGVYCWLPLAWIVWKTIQTGYLWTNLAKLNSTVMFKNRSLGFSGVYAEVHLWYKCWLPPAWICMETDPDRFLWTYFARNLSDPPEMDKIEFQLIRGTPHSHWVPEYGVRTNEVCLSPLCIE